MKKSIKVAPKRRGRPPTGGRDPGVHIRLPKEMIEAIDTYSHADEINRSEAIRRLVEIGLKATQPVKARRSIPNKLRAAELAAKAIDGIIDPSALPEERAQRRRRLTKGPPEFREDRVDLPKAKGK